MNKKIFFISLVLVSVMIFSGCGIKKEKTVENGRVNFGQNQNGMRGGFNTTTFKQMGDKGAVSDLQIGKKVTVTGASNTDGSVNASRIMIGEMPKFERPSSTPERVQAQNGLGTPNGVSDGERPRFVGSGDRPSGGIGQGSGIMAMLNGEILKMDEAGFILKTEKEGSKIIYLTAGTEIYIISSTTPKIGTTTPEGK